VLSKSSAEGACVAFSPDGERVVFCPGDCVQVINIKTGAPDLILQVPAYSAVYSPDGRSIAISGNEGVAIYDASDGRRQATLIDSKAMERVNTCHYTADGTRLLTTSEDGGVVRLWDTISGQELLTVRPFGDFPRQVNLITGEISSDGMRIAVNGKNGAIRVIDIPSPHPLPGLDPKGFVFGLEKRYLLREEVIARLKTDRTLTGPVRRDAIRIAETYPEDNDTLTEILRNEFDAVIAGKSKEYERLRQKAEAVGRLGHYDHPLAGLALGLAEYRLGKFTDAVKTLTWSGSHTSSIPPPAEEIRLAFLAMAQARAGQADAASLTWSELVKLQSSCPRGLYLEAQDVVPRSAPLPHIPRAVE
jgi:WD40 repeat protein